MPDSGELAPETLVLRLSVPSRGELRAIAGDVALKVAEYIGERPEAHAAIGAAVEDVASRVAPGAAEEEIIFEFRRRDDGLLIRAACGGRSAAARPTIAKD